LRIGLSLFHQETNMNRVSACGLSLSAALGFLFRDGSSPAAPFPEPGLDPTADGYDCGGP